MNAILPTRCRPQSSPPVERGYRTAPPYARTGIAPSQNLQLLCQVCCKNGTGAACSNLIPGCICSL